MKDTAQHNKITHPVYDVIIAGAGPVGLFLACELALAKCSVLILEKAEAANSILKKLPFGVRGLSAPSIESLDRRGLLDQLELHKYFKNPHKTAAPTEGPRRQVGHFAGIPFHQGDIDTSQWKYRLPSSTPASLLSEMQEIEDILTRRAEVLGVEIKRGIAISGFNQTDDGVTVQAGERLFQSKWLVGCDGSRSVVRKAGGFNFAGTEPEFTGYSAKVDIADPEKLKTGRNVTERGMYLQSQPGYLNIQDFDGGAFHNSGKPITLEHVQEVLRRISDTDVTITALHIATTWTDRARQATDYRNGRVFLAGDAAHIHAPLGGQGLNLGLGDAMNLGWKLATATHGKAPKGLLDTYYTERYPVGIQVLDWSRAQVEIMKPTPNAQAMYSILSDMINTKDGATYIAGRVWGINMQYDLGSDNPLVGRSVPNFELENGTTIGHLMYDGQGLLIDFTGIDQLKTFANKYPGQIKYFSGKAKEQLGLNSLLVRPDGIVAWATDAEVDMAELEKAAEGWFIS
jgi:2-polyprenyl-6-methoxyphenol hydroxylase-like FAD-dependent oxidoreductase